VLIASIVVAFALAAITAALVADGGGGAQRHRAASRGGLAKELPLDRTDLASEIDRAQEVIDSSSSTSSQLASAGFFEQLATGALSAQAPKLRRQTLAALGAQGAASMRADLGAAAALSGVLAPQTSLPKWEIVRPLPADTLLGYFREAQARFDVPWQDLAAIELIETRFGRVRGVSVAGAQGPMQFLPSTWARYGGGDVEDQRDAILGAARYLAASGAPADMADALYHYNNSRAYVSAVQDYAARMGADLRTFYGYYSWQVLYSLAGTTVLLPEGYPKTRPVPVNVGPGCVHGQAPLC
jgi:hypothetical protein